MRTDDGAGTALALGLVAAVVAALLLAAAVAGLLDAHRRVVAGADAAALAGADTALGNATGTPCVRAAQVAERAGVELEHCAQRGTLIRVRASTVAMGLPFTADAVAGPPPTR